MFCFSFTTMLAIWGSDMVISSIGNVYNGFAPVVKPVSRQSVLNNTVSLVAKSLFKENLEKTRDFSKAVDKTYWDVRKFFEDRIYKQKKVTRAPNDSFFKVKVEPGVENSDKVVTIVRGRKDNYIECIDPNGEVAFRFDKPLPDKFLS